MLQTLGFAPAKAEEICSHIVVEPARGSGHAWPALGRKEPARLRTRIGQGGMDYKGYNIAVHEFGHNVEQVLDMYDIDYYTLAGVPNTAFTEASAFLFQARDLELLENKKSPSKTLSNSPFKGELERGLEGDFLSSSNSKSRAWKRKADASVNAVLGTPARV